MTGPDHYVIAEELLFSADDHDPGSLMEVSLLAEAQVHATLALVAATAPRGSGEWQAVVSPTKDDEIVP